MLWSLRSSFPVKEMDWKGSFTTSLLFRIALFRLHRKISAIMILTMAFASLLPLSCLSILLPSFFLTSKILDSGFSSSGSEASFPLDFPILFVLLEVPSLVVPSSWILLNKSALADSISSFQGWRNGFLSPFLAVNVGIDRAFIWLTWSSARTPGSVLYFTLLYQLDVRSSFNEWKWHFFFFFAIKSLMEDLRLITLFRS